MPLNVKHKADGNSLRIFDNNYNSGHILLEATLSFSFLDGDLAIIMSSVVPIWWIL